MSFAWARGLVFPSQAYFYGNWEKGKQNKGKMSLTKGVGCVQQTCLCLEFPTMEYEHTETEKKGKIVELLEDQPKKKDLISISFKLICSLP